MAIRYISRLTGITLGDSGIKAQERQKIFVFDLKIPIFWTAFRYITVPLCFIAANSALKRLMHVTLFCKAVIKGSIGSDGKHVLQPGRWIFLPLYFYLCIGLLPFQFHRITISAFCKQIRRPVCFFVKSSDRRHFILVKLLLLPFFLCI